MNTIGATGAANNTMADVGVHRVARDVRDVDLATYQRVVRQLLVHPLVTRTNPQLVASIRRWERELREDLANTSGYALEVSATTCRLVRRPLNLDGSRPLITANTSRRPFNARRYAYLCLVLGGLLSCGSQALLSDLAGRLADDAANIDGLGFDRDEYAHRTAFIDVIQWLDHSGAIDWRDGAAGSVSADLDEDALYDVDHEAVHALVPSLGLGDLASIASRFDDNYGESRDELRRRHRHRVTRMILERSVVLLEDLDPDERAWMQRNGTRLADDIERLTGLQLERRREGVALIDTEGDGSDRRYPAGGSPAQLALLLGDFFANAEDPPLTVSLPTVLQRHETLASTIDAARQFGGSMTAPTKGSSATGGPTATWAATTSPEVNSPENGSAEMPPAPSTEVTDRAVGAWPMSVVDEIVAKLVVEYPVRRDLRDDPIEASRVAAEVLAAFDLIRITHGPNGELAVVPMAPLARYRAIPPEPEISPQLDLFGAQP